MSKKSHQQHQKSNAQRRDQADGQPARQLDDEPQQPAGILKRALDADCELHAKTNKRPLDIHQHASGGIAKKSATAAAAAAQHQGPEVNPPAPASGTNPVDALANVCAACNKPIRERYLLMALDKRWHEDCLKCACCDCRLGEVGSSLFTHSNKLLCRRDFLRIFGQQGHCAACRRPIPPYELVMRAQDKAYHLDCFACQRCQYRFCVGDRFHLTERHKIICLLCHNEQQRQEQEQEQEQQVRQLQERLGGPQTPEEQRPAGCFDRQPQAEVAVGNDQLNDGNLNLTQLKSVERAPPKQTCLNETTPLGASVSAASKPLVDPAASCPARKMRPPPGQQEPPAGERACVM